MKSNIKEIKDKIPKSCLIIMVVQFLLIIYMVFPVFPYEIVIKSGRYSIIFISFFLLIWALVRFFKEGQFGKISKSSKMYFYGLSFVSLIMVFPTIIGEAFDSAQIYQLNYFVIDLYSILLYMSGIVFAPTERHKYLKNYYLFLGIIGVVLGTIGLFTTNYTLNGVVDRNINTWTMSYYLWFSLYTWPILLTLNLLSKNKSWRISEKFIVYSTVILYFILGLLFLKRVIVIEAALIFAIIIFKTKGHKYLFKICGFVLIMILSVYFLSYFTTINTSHLISLVMDRFEGQNISEFNRFVEFKNGICDFNFLNYFLGRGYGSIHFGLWEQGHGNMHIAWLNYIFKGGLVFFLVQVSIFLKILKIFLFSNKNSPYVSISIFNFLIAGISTFWTPSPAVLTFSIFVFVSLNHNNYIDNKSGGISSLNTFKL